MATVFSGSLLFEVGLAVGSIVKGESVLTQHALTSVLSHRERKKRRGAGVRVRWGENTASRDT
jgi:hypothetical protein